MKNEELISKAKYVVFKGDNCNDYTSNINEDIERLPINDVTNDRYFHYNINGIANQHHYTSKYHYMIVLPAINRLLKFNYNLFDFNLTEDVKIIDGDDGGIYSYDFSYLIPKKKTTFTCYYDYFEYDKEEHVVKYVRMCDNLRFEDLVSVKECCNEKFFKTVNGNRTDTAYHRLFKFTHQCCVIENNSNDNNGKTLLISCDSQMVPSIPILSYYYKKVIVIDNRYGTKWNDIYNNEKIDDVLISIYLGHTMKYFIENNFSK